MKLIPLTCGRHAIVDDEDYEHLSKYNWHYISYAVRTDRTSGKQKTVYMHRQIMGSGPQADHINGDRLDNRRSNLRPATNSQNQRNKAKYSGQWTSEYKGVTKYRNGRWIAGIYIDNKRMHLGYFNSEEDAAQAYNFAAAKHFGEYAKLNEAA